MRNHSTIALTAVLLLIAGCPAPNDTGPESENDAGAAALDAGSTPFDAGSTSASRDAGLVTADGGMACVPTACTGCGMVDDGCGHTLDCGACACTPSTFSTDCPSRPCEVATACTANTCVYEPVTCQFERCTCTSATDGGCSDTERRSCGAGCANNFCEPTPGLVAGKIVYANVCKGRDEVRCGTCDLGGLQCESDGGVVCQGVTIVGVNPEFIECNGGSPAASILFVDPAYGGGTHTGSQEAPFITLAEAFSAAGVRNARAIIIGGAPTFTLPLNVANGVSVLGGFSGVPNWVRDDSRRPVFHVPASSLANGSLVALVASDITTATEVANVDFITPDLAASPAATGASNFGALITNAGALTLRAVHFSVGDAQSGAGGANAIAPTGVVPTSNNGNPATSANKSCPISGLPITAGGAGQTPVCQGLAQPNGRGGDGASVVKVVNSSEGIVYTRGQSSVAGMTGGLASYTSQWNAGPGQDGAPWADAVSGTTPTVSLVWSNNRPAPQGQGIDGAPGVVGRGGGGGGGGGSSESQAPVCRVGGGGGAGGSGGCGGNAGLGGFAGGWSFGLVVTASNGLVFKDVVAQVGRGGKGGVGGLGTPGLEGNNGGLGGPQSMNLPAYNGSNGGKGGQGQRGGNGGDGADGQSRGVICQSPSQLTLTGLSASPKSSSSGFSISEGCQ